MSDCEKSSKTQHADSVNPHRITLSFVRNKQLHTVTFDTDTHFQIGVVPVQDLMAIMPELRKYNATYDKLKIIHLLNMQAGFDFTDIYSLRHLKNLHKMCLLQYGRNYSKVFRHMGNGQ